MELTETDLQSPSDYRSTKIGEADEAVFEYWMDFAGKLTIASVDGSPPQALSKQFSDCERKESEGLTRHFSSQSGLVVAASVI